MKPHNLPGKFIVFEGLDGSGQTTQAHLLAEWLSKRNQPAYYTKEPTDGPVGALLKLALAHRLSAPSGGKEYRPLSAETLALFFAADRMDHLHNDVIPKLQDGVYVISDRYYVSSFAYQSVSLAADWIRELNKHAIQPDITFFLDVPPTICVKRMQVQRWHVELFEDLATLERVRERYLEALLNQRIIGERVEELDGNQPVADVHAEVVRLTKDLLRTTMARRANGASSDQRELELRVTQAEPLTEREIAAYQQG